MLGDGDDSGAIVYFYAPWCKACALLAPSFAEFRTVLGAAPPAAAARALAVHGWGYDTEAVSNGPAVPGVSAYRVNVDANDLADLVPGLAAATQILPAVGYFPSGPVNQPFKHIFIF